MKIVVDTNIVFSAILNSKSRIAETLINSDPSFEFYSCEYLKTEIFKHRGKLINLTGLSLDKIEELEAFSTQEITFYNHLLLPTEKTILSEKLLKTIDPFDIPFVELTQYLGAILWTGDKKLLQALNESGFHDTITTQNLCDLIENL